LYLAKRQYLAYWHLACLLLAGALLSLSLVLVTQLLHFQFSFPTTLRWVLEKPGMLLAGMLMVYGVWLLLFFGVGRFLPACFLTSALALLMAVINWLKYLYRGEPFVPRDFAMALNLGQLAQMVSPVIGFFMLVAVLAAAGICILVCRFWPRRRFSPVQQIGGLVLAAALAVSTLTGGFTHNPVRGVYRLLGADLASYALNVYGSYDENGFFTAFSSQIGQPLMVRPQGYGREAVEAIVEEYAAKSSAANAQAGAAACSPNIVYVMSEAFSDPTLFPAYTFSRDPLPAIRQRMAELPSGRALVPGRGGATAHCEFEALTGFSIAYCGGISAYENNLNRQKVFPALPRTLAERGYRTVALHPYNSSMYARPKAYAAMGFDEFLDQTAMRHTEKTADNPYISDESAYNEVLELLGETQEPAFVHLVTMQNHGGYKAGRFGNGLTVTGEDAKSAAKVETYSRGLALTDSATDAFLEELAGLAEDTVVVFWGDHLPMTGYPEEYLERQGLGQYETPLFFWTSYPVENRDLGALSPIFFPYLVNELAGGEQTPYLALLEELSGELRGVRTTGVVTAQGDFTEEYDLPVLEKYRIIQYDSLLGGQYAQEAGFFT